MAPPRKRTIIKCAYCQKDFEIRLCYLKRKQVHCCSVSCAYYYRLYNPDDSLGTQKRTGVKRKHKYSWTVDKDGYIWFNRGIYKNRFLHRVVMEYYLKRPLLRSECIHHIDGNRLNNNIGNLLIVTISEHKRIHDKLRAEAILARKECGL